MNHIKILYLITLLIIFNFNLNAQNELEYSEVVKVTGVSKDILYSNGLIWFAETFKDSRAVIEAKDREAGMIIGNGIFEYYAGKGLKYRDFNGHIQFTVKVMFKEGRTKIELTSFTHKPSYLPFSLGIITQSEKYPYPKVYKGYSDKWHQYLWDDLKSDISLKSIELLGSFKNFITDNANQSDDW